MSDKLRDILQKSVGLPKGAGQPADKPARSTSGGKNGGIVSPDDERGTPYPGDFPNPLDGKTPGCF